MSELWIVPFERVLVGLWLLALLALGLLAWRRAGWPRPRLPWLLGAAGAFVALVAARLALPGALVHANNHGYALVQVIFQFPATHTTHADYGQSSFVVLGALAALFGDNLDTVFVANAVLGAGVVSLAGWLAYELSGSRLAVAATVAAGLLLPAFVRIAASEDSHNAAVFFGLLSVTLLVRARRRGAVPLQALVAPVLALLLAFFGRQTMLLYPALVALLIPRATWRALLRHPGGLTGLVLVLLALGFRLVAQTGDVSSTAFIILLSSIPFLLVPELLAKHPLFEPPSLAFLGGFALVLWTLPRSPRRYDLSVLVLAAGANFLLSWGAVIAPGDHGQYGMRLPMLALMLPIAGVAVAATVHRLTSPWRPALAALLLGALVLAPLAGYLDLFAHQDQEVQELRSIARHAAFLDPEGLVLFPHDRSEPGFPTSYPHPGIFPPGVRTAYRGESLDLMQGGGMPTRLYVYVGVPCAIYSLFTSRQGASFFREPSSRSLWSYADLFVAGWNRPREAWRRIVGEPPPGSLRAECLALPSGVEGHFRPWARIAFGAQEFPHIYLAVDSFDSGVWEVDSPEMITRALAAYGITFAEPGGGG